MEQIKSLINEILDLCTELPPEKLREVFDISRHPKNLDFIKTIGNTTYIVTSRFNPNASEDMMRKVRRMILDNEQ